MTKNPKLYIPQPTARPGEEPDFSYLNLSAAGAADRPPVDAAASDIEDLATGLVRVLDDDHAAKGPWDPGLNRETLNRGASAAVHPPHRAAITVPMQASQWYSG